MSHVIRINESCVTCQNVSCHTYEWIMPHVWLSYANVLCHSSELRHSAGNHRRQRTSILVTRMNEACHTWMSHATRVNESCHTCACVVSHIWMSHVTRTCHDTAMSYAAAQTIIDDKNDETPLATDLRLMLSITKKLRTKRTNRVCMYTYMHTCTHKYI